MQPTKDQSMKNEHSYMLARLPSPECRSCFSQYSSPQFYTHLHHTLSEGWNHPKAHMHLHLPYQHAPRGSVRLGHYSRLTSKPFFRHRSHQSWSTQPNQVYCSMHKDDQRVYLHKDCNDTQSQPAVGQQLPPQNGSKDPISLDGKRWCHKWSQKEERKEEVKKFALIEYSSSQLVQFPKSKSLKANMEVSRSFESDGSSMNTGTTYSSDYYQDTSSRKEQEDDSICLSMSTSGSGPNYESMDRTDDYSNAEAVHETSWELLQRTMLKACGNSAGIDS